MQDSISLGKSVGVQEKIDRSALICLNIGLSNKQ